MRSGRYERVDCIWFNIKATKQFPKIDKLNETYLYVEV